ncbi:BRCA2-interacting transcriptional repressor EMSY [Amphibalanus amphitrite]|uniref:BRCA2-interacting transcriptional repressor EMSY n=1 Tax=Amphibalanus amphitrite TaxID=1232801 RepID=A0A6A4XG14_AMPAM|nr:BRCA2-interacting transcriptional repressor EMSY [Amphibalanus amphitrite]
MLPAEAIQWPTLLDMTKEECQRVLRRFELTAYSGVVSAFRGQGELTKEKRRLLAELAGALGVPADRHRAEVRRAANDEALNTIAHRLAGAGTRTDWAVEGRRVVPVLPRGRPITAYTAVADASRARAERLAGRLPPPGDTRSYEPAPAPAVPSGPPPAAAAATPHLRPPSPTPGVIRLPSGMSIQLEDELQGRGRKRRRSSSSSDTGPRIHPAPAARTQVIFVSSSSGAPSPVVACPPRTTVLSEPGPLPGPPPGPPPGPGPGPGVIQSPGVIQGPGGAAAAGERRPRPLDPNTDTYRQMAGLDSRGKPMASRTPVRARGRVGRLPTNCPSSQPGKSATRVATGVKIITHTVPLAAAGTKVMTKGGGQPVLVVPSSAAPPPGAAAAAAAAVRPAVAVRTGSGGRVVTVSGGVGRQLVRHSLHGYALPRAVHVGRSPSGGSPTNRAPASVIVLQKSAAGRPPTVVRPPRARSDSGAAAVFVSAPQTASPAGRLPAPSPAPTPSAAPAPLSAAAAPAAAPVSAQVRPLGDCLRESRVIRLETLETHAYL